MKFNMKKARPLLAWMNTMFPEKHVWEFVPMRDGLRLLKICFKLRGSENTEDFKTLSLYKKMEIIFSVLHDDFHLTKRQSSLILQRISGGIDLELQLAKVALLLCYCTFKKGILLPMDSDVESDVTSMFRFVKEDADGLSLEEGLDQFLAQDSFMNVVNSSSGSIRSSPLYTDDESPIVNRSQRPPRVQFQELCTVASSSDGSPVQDVMSTPHFQLKKLRKELAHEGDVRDELEKELTNQICIISEKEGVISQLQHRVERMLREQGELEKEHKAALLELQEKNESLLHRVHEVLKQCQDLKTDNSQKERKIDELTEENGSLTAQVRNVFAQLASAEEEVAKLTLAHESAQTEWKSRKEFLEKELNEAVTHKESMSEQVQILQGKISVLEDELQRAQSQEKGEVLGPIMEWEKLKQELSDLTLKLAQLQDTISHLEKEKAEVKALLAEERGSFEKETKRLQMVVFDLEQSINSIRLERETLQEAFRTQKEMLTTQISALESDVSRLQQVEVELTAEIKISADLRQQREELEGKVASLDKMVHALHTEIQGLEMERASQQDALNALIVDLQSARATIQDHEKKLEEHQKVVQENESLKKETCTLQQGLDEHLQSIGDLQEQINILRQEKTEEENKVSQASTKIKSLQTQILDLSQQISLKDEEIRNLRSEYDNVGHELRLVKEQNIEINEMIKSNRKEHEDTVKKLQQELDSASSLASEKQEEMLVLSVEVTTLKEQICRYSENEVKKQQELSVLEAQHNVLKGNMTSIQNQLAEVTATASQKESELLLLQQELSHQATLKEKALELEAVKGEEFEKKLSELQAKIVEVSTLASQREAQIISLQNEMKDQQLCAKQSEEDLRRELEQKVGTLQGELDTVNRCVVDKDKLLGSLDQKLKEMEGLFHQKEKDVLEMHQAKEELEKRIVELNVETQQLSECQHNLEILSKERDHLSTEVISLKAEIRGYQDTEVQKQQVISVLEVERNTLKENMAVLEKKLVEETTAASQKHSELHQQESLREKAQELETAKREELEITVNELQAKILELSTLASEREACVNSLQDQLNAKQSEDDIRKVLEEKVASLQGQLETASRDVSDKDQLLKTLDQKLKQMDLLCQQKEKDVHQVKEDLEKKIGELVVEKHQLVECQQNLETVRKERDNLSTEVTSLKDEIRHYQEKEVQKQQEISVLEVERNTLKENLATFKTQVAELTTTASQKESELLLLRKEVCEQDNLKEKSQKLEKDVRELQAKILQASTLASEREAQLNSLKDEINDKQLREKQSEDELCRVLEEKIATLQKRLETSSCDVLDKDHLLQSLELKLKQVELLCQQKKKEVLETQHSKEDLEKKIGELLDEKQQKLEEYQQNLEMVRKERETLSTEVLEIKHSKEDLVKRIGELLVEKRGFQEDLEIMRREKDNLSTQVTSLKDEIQSYQNEVQKISVLEEENQELLEQLKTKSEVVEHYKAQVEKAVSHYNSKKQLLVEAQELNKTLEHSLEASKSEVKVLETKLTQACMELNQASTKEKNLSTKVKSLEAQVDFADRQLQEQKMMTNDKENMRHRDSLYTRVQEKQQDISTDSLEFEPNDSFNANSHSSILGESSTPLVRSSERLAAKRRALGTESLETLYFTPMGQQDNKRKGYQNNDFEHKLASSITSIGDLVVDSAKKPTASARRRRTTQAINITMAKKTSGCAEGEESFYSLHSAQSQPNLAGQHSRLFSMDLSEENATATLSRADTLQRLPGYRRSTVHNAGLPGATSTFCIGAENEPEHAAEDWMRIAELQWRNQACLPHLKSSYPLESRPSLGPSFTITDEDLRMGDPSETIRRASMMPGQIQESLNNRRFSLVPSSSQSSANSRPQRATMLPGQIQSSTAAHRLKKTSSNLRASENKRSPLAPKRPGSQLQAPDTPEMKKMTSCFPRQMTPKSMFGSSQNKPPKSPAERRQSVMFTVVNTPKNSGRGDSRLQRGLNKLRNSARKSPAVASRALRSAAGAKSPLDSTLRKSPRNKSPKSSNAKKTKIRIKL
ncbi:nuclear mitotic apparatus protein 1 isoform X1 [Carassius auratus]|uniref:Nuclear mitotic apparatus protein 1 isoform X1 n=1 Tax=Carassius auratus TaxID=7957 RepID=A0A6P6QW68_CARAU|nr:nuclear mitotic apparatus protein 1 isoform X1 [Carassius auratus]